MWDKIKEMLNIKFHSTPVYDKKHIKAKVREFYRVIKTNFSCDKVPKENRHYTCIACVTIDFVMRMENKNYPQIYLEQFKYKMKKSKMTKFIKAKLESDSGSDSVSESESKSDSDLMVNLECVSDSEYIICNLNSPYQCFN